MYGHPRSTRLIHRRRMVTITGMAPQQPRPPQRAGVTITGWTEGMATRLRHFLENFRQDFTVMVTLTYPDDYPTDGQTVKAHLRALFERMRRKGCLEFDSWVWFLEFQQRGAPHFHILGTGWIPKGWLSDAWAEITKGNSRTCTRVEQIRNPNAAGAYAMKYAYKSEQKEVPEGFERVGRMWGCVGPRTIPTLFGPEPRVPRVEAYTGFPLSWAVTAAKRFCYDWKAGRISQTEAGLVFYGTPEETNALWLYLQDAGLFADVPETRHAKSRRRTQADLPV